MIGISVVLGVRSKAFEIRTDVPVAETVPVTRAVEHWLNAAGGGCYWTLRTYRQIEKISRVRSRWDRSFNQLRVIR